MINDGMSFTTACTEFHNHNLSVVDFWDWLVRVRGIDALILRLGLFQKVILLCGGT